MTTTIEDCARFILKEFFIPNVEKSNHTIGNFNYSNRKTYEFLCYDREKAEHVWIFLIDTSDAILKMDLRDCTIVKEKQIIQTYFAVPEFQEPIRQKISNLVLTVNCEFLFYNQATNEYKTNNNYKHINCVNFKNWEECKEYLDTL